MPYYFRRRTRQTASAPNRTKVIPYIYLSAAGRRARGEIVKGAYPTGGKSRPAASLSKCGQSCIPKGDPMYLLSHRICLRMTGCVRLNLSQAELPRDVMPHDESGLLFDGH
jgi:hypothetical protein